MRLEQGDTVRALADRYLKDPDLWPQILTLSGYDSTLDLSPGKVVKIPVAPVARADAALSSSLQSIQSATAEGARIFAPRQITSAIDLRDNALSHRKAGEWDETTVAATESRVLADEALAVSLQARDRAAEAIVSDAHGRIEGRNPAQSRWSTRKLNDILVEYERVRTLSESTAQVTFRDLSKLRLNPNSNAVIQRMRADPLTGRQVTKVSLDEGDLYALLNDLGGRSDFQVEVSGVETTHLSNDFWIGRDKQVARFANYDDTDMTLVSNGQVIAIGKNEGALLRDEAGTATTVRILDVTELVAPADGFAVYNGEVTLEWKQTPTAEGYWLEIASDADFGRMKVSKWGIRDVAERVGALDPGMYFWRVSAVDRLGLPGARSLARRFEVRLDATPPYLKVLTPADGAVLRAALTEVTGEADADSRLSVNGRYVALTENGHFGEAIEAVPGENVIVVEAVDSAGNKTRRERRFVYRPDRTAEVSFDPAIPRDAEGRLLTDAATLSVSGTTSAEPGSRVVVLGASGEVAAQSLVDAGGGFNFSVPAATDGTGYDLSIVAVSGAVDATAQFVALQDQVPPEVIFDVPPPTVTSDAWVELSGTAGDARELLVNGAPVALVGGRFELAAPLQPGENVIDFLATDQVGNVSVASATVVQDIEPPEIGAVAVGRARGNRELIEISIAATDAAGLRQAAAYLARVGADERRGFLRYDAGSGVYRDSFPAGTANVKLVEVTVQDYAGNKADLRLE